MNAEHTIRRVSPLAGWTMGDVEAYARDNDIPLLPLYDLGYTSIGCRPCTSVPMYAANPRSGRWDGLKLECGIHLQAVQRCPETGDWGWGIGVESNVLWPIPGPGPRSACRSYILLSP